MFIFQTFILLNVIFVNVFCKNVSSHGTLLGKNLIHRLRFRHLLPAVFDFSRHSALRIFEAGSKTRNARQMPKFVSRALLHETIFRATPSNISLNTHCRFICLVEANLLNSISGKLETWKQYWYIDNTHATETPCNILQWNTRSTWRAVYG